MNLKNLNSFFLISFALIIAGSCFAQSNDAKAIAFGKQIETELNNGNGAFVDKAVDADTFVNRMHLIDIPFREKFETRMRTSLHIGSNIAQNINASSKLTYLRHYVKDGRHHLLFRLFVELEIKLNYFDFELLESGDEFKIADVYMYLAGETQSATMAGFFNQMM